ncbi:MAG: dCTP deaminase domain-containing protein [Culicoidibacterales bacterium]
MLSKNNFFWELGKSICIVPFDAKNLKENSINLTVGDMAWSLASDTYVKITNGTQRAECIVADDANEDSILIKQGESTIIDYEGIKYVVLLPHSVTAIRTTEILGVNAKVGGTYHTRVQTAMMGIGHISTMLGPNFCGYSLVPVQNISDKPILLKVGEPFVSVVFHKLKRKYKSDNHTVSAHTDIFAKYGIKPTDSELEELNNENNKKFIVQKKKMLQNQLFKNYLDEGYCLTVGRNSLYLPNLISKSIRFVFKR